jgi:hypothetical protein
MNCFDCTLLLFGSVQKEKRQSFFWRNVNNEWVYLRLQINTLFQTKEERTHLKG